MGNIVLNAIGKIVQKDLEALPDVYDIVWDDVSTVSWHHVSNIV